MYQETLSQNTCACRAVAPRHVTTGLYPSSGPARGQQASGTAQILPNAGGATGETNLAHGNECSQGRREGCAAARTRSKHSPASSQRWGEW